MGIRQKEMCKFEKAILNAIKEAGLTQVELAARSGVSQGLLSLFLETAPSKRRTITLPVANRLCKALGLELVQTKIIKKGVSKMPKIIPFRKKCNFGYALDLCKQPIQIRRGKMVCEQIIKEIHAGLGGLTEDTRDWLSKWVNPARKEPKVHKTFLAISKEFFGYRITRSDRKAR